MKELILEACCGNREAHEFLAQMYQVSNVWDNLIDGDAVDAHDINNVFLALLLALPRNQFYNQHFGRLYPLVANAVANWQISNNLRSVAPERGWMLRDGYCDLVREVANILGGAALALSVGTKVQVLMNKERSLTDYLRKWSSDGIQLDSKGP